MTILRNEALELVPRICEAAFRVNNSAVFKHTIGRVAIFGSVLTAKTVLGDLDIAVELLTREQHDAAAFVRIYPLPPGLSRYPQLWENYVTYRELQVHPLVNFLPWQFLFRAYGPNLPHRVILSTRQVAA
jgi:hypothetical protein